MGLLDNFSQNMNQPGQSNALGLLGAYLMAAGGPQTDPSAAGRLLAEGTAQYQNALRQSKLDVGNAQMADLRRSALDQQITARQQADAEKSKLRSLLQGTPTGAAHDAGVMAVPGGMSNAPVEGLLAGHPILQAVAGVDPTAAATGLLQKQNLDSRLKSREKIAGMRQGGPTAFDKKVDALVASGVPRDRALGIASGRYRASDGILFDLAENQKPSAPPDAPPAPKLDVEPGVGGEGLFKEAANTVTDMFGAGMFFPEAAKASEALKRMNVVTKTTLQDAVPGRPSNYLLQEFDKLVVKPASLLQGEERTIIKLNGTRDLFDRAIRSIDTHLSAQNIGRTDRQKWQAKRIQLQGMKDQYDGLIAGFRGGNKGGGQGPAVGAVEDGYEFLGGNPADPNSWRKK